MGDAVRAGEIDGEVEILLVEDGGVPLGHRDPVAIGALVGAGLGTLAEAEQDVHVDGDRVVLAVAAIGCQALDLAGVADIGRGGLPGQLDVARGVVEDLHIGARPGVDLPRQAEPPDVPAVVLLPALALLLLLLLRTLLLGHGEVGQDERAEAQGDDGGKDTAHAGGIPIEREAGRRIDADPATLAGDSG